MLKAGQGRNQASPQRHEGTKLVKLFLVSSRLRGESLCFAAAGCFPLNANEKYTRNRMRMRQVVFCPHFTGSRRVPRLRAKSLPMLS
jgi:uncharacterized ParB-like nuclease family protein